jgi:hypothetical protein
VLDDPYAAIPEKFATVPQEYEVDRLTWDEYKAAGLHDDIDLGEVMSPRDLSKLRFEVLRDPDGKIVATRGAVEPEGNRWFTPEEWEAATQAFFEWEDELNHKLNHPPGGAGPHGM